MSPAIGYTRILNDRFVVPIKAREVLNPGQANCMFNLDFSEVNTKEHPLSQEERRFMEKAKQGNRLCPDARYEMPLPLKNAEVVLPNNRELALRRLIPLKKRSSSCRSYQDQYTAFMDSMFKNFFFFFVFFFFTITYNTYVTRNITYTSILINYYYMYTNYTFYYT